MIKVLIVDDHELIRVGLQRLLADYADIEVVGQAENGEQAVEQSKLLNPDVVLMDINMPDLDGMEATRKILRSSKQAKIIIVTVIEADPFPSKLLQLGASGYISKGASANELYDAIKTVNRGERYLTPKLAQKVALMHISDESESPFDALSERETQVMQMVINGEKAPDIAEKLFLSSKTINSYRYRLFKKLHIKSDVELTHMAIKYGLLKLEELSSQAQASLFPNE